MALWRNLRRLSFLSAIQGVKEQGVLDVITPAQAVVIVDDASVGVQPVTVARGFVAPTSAPAAVEHSGIEFSAGAGGLLLERWWQTGPIFESTDLWRDDDQVVAVRTPVVLSQVGGVPNGERFESSINSVQIAAAARPASRVTVSTGTLALHGMWQHFMRPGERWYYVRVGANVALAQTFQLREVPQRDRNAA